MADAPIQISRVLAARRRKVTSGLHGPRNLIVQALSIGMIGLGSLLMLPSVVVMSWVAATVAATLAEDRLLARADKAPVGSSFYPRLAAVLRVVVTTLFALAAFALIVVKGGAPGDRLFGFAIISAAAVNVLMRHYRSPIILSLSLVPWVGILALVAFGLARSALQAGDLLRAVSSLFVIGMLGVEFWSARQQLSAAWSELMTTLAGVTQAKAALKETQRIAKIGSWRLAVGASHVEWSPELNGIFGFDASEAQPHLGRVLERMDDDGRMRLQAARDAGSTEPFTFSTQVRQPNGETRICWVEGRPEFGPDGARIGVSGFCQDITDREAATAQLRQAQKMESVGQLTGGLAHDFNNLLAVIIGNLDLITAELAESSLEKEFADTAMQAALKGSELTQQLLAFSRQQPLDPKTIDLNELVAGMAPLWRRTLSENVVVKLVTSDDTWNTKLDRAQMESSLLNLVINARDAMPDGGVLTIETGNAAIDPDNPELPPGDYAMVAVSDTGHGMSQEVLAKVVEPFFTTKGVGKGSGLGLSMIYGFAKQSGGQLRIYSEVGHGTTVRLYLPRSTDTVVSASVSAPGLIHGQGERVLVVEDNPDVRRVAVRQLKGLGYRVTEADTGASGLEALARNDIDLVFSDIVMPGGMTGVEMVQRARQERPGLKVLFTSGFTSAATTSNSRVTGADPMISKPYRVADLANKLREVLATRPEPEEGQPDLKSPRRRRAGAMG